MTSQCVKLLLTVSLLVFVLVGGVSVVTADALQDQITQIGALGGSVTWHYSTNPLDPPGTVIIDLMSIPSTAMDIAIIPGPLGDSTIGVAYQVLRAKPGYIESVIDGGIVGTPGLLTDANFLSDSRKPSAPLYSVPYQALTSLWTEGKYTVKPLPVPIPISLRTSGNYHIGVQYS